MRQPRLRTVLGVPWFGAAGRATVRRVLAPAVVVGMVMTVAGAYWGVATAAAAPRSGLGPPNTWVGTGLPPPR